MVTQNLPTSNEMKSFFDNFYKKQLTFPSNQIDAVVGFFQKRGFDTDSARMVCISILMQAKLDNINPFRIIDTLKGLTNVQLSQIVSKILNSARQKTSVLGYKVIVTDETTESRNIRI